MLTLDVLTLFPGAFSGFLDSSMVARAIAKSKLKVRFTDFRKYSQEKHHNVDDYPYGGFPGMVLSPQPVYDALKHLLAKGTAPVVYFTPQGRQLNQPILESYTRHKRIILLCGHYKELDQRIRNLCVSDELSVGDYVLSGGELPAMLFIDGLARLLPGVLSDLESAASDSFSTGKLGFPCFTRPDTFMEQSVPQILRQGNHKLINAWAETEAEQLTRTRRPDLTNKHD